MSPERGMDWEYYIKFRKEADGKGIGRGYRGGIGAGQQGGIRSASARQTQARAKGDIQQSVAATNAHEPGKIEERDQGKALGRPGESRRGCRRPGKGEPFFNAQFTIMGLRVWGN